MEQAVLCFMYDGAQRLIKNTLRDITQWLAVALHLWRREGFSHMDIKHLNYCFKKQTETNLYPGTDFLLLETLELSE